MGMLSCHARRLRAGLALVLLAAMLAAPAAALADRGGRDGDHHGDGDHNGGGGGFGDDDHDGRGSHLNCPGRETLVRIDEQICEANPHRPLIVRKRACCKNPAGRVHCDHFPHCPHESES
jgi:hypothetical protein